MTTTANRAGFWTDQVWSSIDDGVTTTVGAIRVAQKVFQNVTLSGVTSVPADRFDPENMAIAEGLTKPYIELAVEFRLSNGQVNSDAAGTTAITLAKLAAKSLALAEDTIILQGKDAILPKTVRIESGEDSIGDGILGLVSHRRIIVDGPHREARSNSGDEILAAIAKGIALLTKELQAPAFALIGGTNAHAATWGSVINGAPAFTVLNSVLSGGIYGTGAMPSDSALLVALGGDPTTIYIDSDPTTEPTHKAGAGQYFFRTFERVQYVARDQRAFVRLDFPSLAPQSGAKKE